MKPAENRARSAARLAAVQALYQMETAGTGVESVILEFTAHRLGGSLEGVALYEAEADFFAALARGVVQRQTQIDRVIEKRLAANWSLRRIDATARAILRAAAFELLHREDIPARVVIDEYVEIARAFFEDGAEPQFVNAVLDAAARDARAEEFGGE